MWWRSSAVLALVAVLSQPANAILLTSSAGIPTAAPTINFSQFAEIGRTDILIGDPPLEIDALQNETVLLRPISGTSNVAIILGEHTPPIHPDNSFYLMTNGHWGPDRDGFLGISHGGGQRVVARIEFANGPVAFIGGLFNYPPDPRWLPVIMTALDSNLSIIEQHYIDIEAPISTPGQNNVGEFRGIMREQAEIFAIEINAPFAVMDDIRFGREIPEPSTSSLSALAILMAISKRRANRHQRR